MADRWASFRARAPVIVVFAVLGLSTGTWAARIPAIKAGLNLSPGILGLCPLGPALGIDVIVCALCAGLAGFLRPRATQGRR
jgi:hypothetical protein